MEVHVKVQFSHRCVQHQRSPAWAEGRTLRPQRQMQSAGPIWHAVNISHGWQNGHFSEGITLFTLAVNHQHCHFIIALFHLEIESNITKQSSRLLLDLKKAFVTLPTILLMAECVSSEAMTPLTQTSRSPFLTPAFSAAPPFTGLIVNLPFSPTAQISWKWLCDY